MKIKKLQWKTLQNQRMQSYLYNDNDPISRAFLYEITNHWWKEYGGTIKTGHKLTFLSGFGNPEILAVSPDIQVCIDTAQGHFAAIIQLAVEDARPIC